MFSRQTRTEYTWCKKISQHRIICLGMKKQLVLIFSISSYSFIVFHLLICVWCLKEMSFPSCISLVVRTGSNVVLYVTYFLKPEFIVSLLVFVLYSFLTQTKDYLVSGMWYIWQSMAQTAYAYFNCDFLQWTIELLLESLSWQKCPQWK